MSSGAEERGLHVPDEGRRCQHSPRRGGRGRAGRLRQVPADVHRLQNGKMNLLLLLLLTISL